MTAMAMPRTVYLYGELGEKYGKEFKMHVASVKEALSLFMANFKDFRQHLVDSDGRLAGYEVWDGNYNLEGKDHEFAMQGSEDIKIIPVVKGAGPVGKIIAGVVLVIIGAVISIYTVGSGTPLIMAGVGLIAGGIAEKLAPKPKGTTTAEDVANAQSYIFSGAVNSTKQGNPVAIGYGEMIVGSQVISASIVSNDIPI